MPWRRRCGSGRSRRWSGSTGTIVYNETGLAMRIPSTVVTVAALGIASTGSPDTVPSRVAQHRYVTVELIAARLNVGEVWAGVRFRLDAGWHVYLAQPRRLRRPAARAVDTHAAGVVGRRNRVAGPAAHPVQSPGEHGYTTRSFCRFNSRLPGPLCVHRAGRAIWRLSRTCNDRLRRHLRARKSDARSVSRREGSPGGGMPRTGRR